jgi:[ribosomal protein S5]-alanine N-acetyltransferase
MRAAPLPRRAGPRVHLAFPRRRDQTEVLTLNRHGQSFHRSWATPPRTPAQFLRYLARSRSADFVGLLIRGNVDDTILGSLELSQIVRGVFQSAYLGYQIGAPFARQGYMSEALALALHDAFGQLRLHRLEANVQPENVASLALVQRLGFHLEGYSPRYLKLGGRWRDHQRWAILAEDWRSGRRSRPSGGARHLPDPA